MIMRKEGERSKVDSLFWVCSWGTVAGTGRKSKMLGHQVYDEGLSVKISQHCKKMLESGNIK
jgi:hypothetical protein